MKLKLTIQSLMCNHRLPPHRLFPSSRSSGPHPNWPIACRLADTRRSWHDDGPFTRHNRPRRVDRRSAGAACTVARPDPTCPGCRRVSVARHRPSEVLGWPTHPTDFNRDRLGARPSRHYPLGTRGDRSDYSAAAWGMETRRCGRPGRWLPVSSGGRYADPARSPAGLAIARNLGLTFVSGRVRHGVCRRDDGGRRHRLVAAAAPPVRAGRLGSVAVTAGRQNQATDRVQIIDHNRAKRSDFIRRRQKIRNHRGHHAGCMRGSDAVERIFQG